MRTRHDASTRPQCRGGDSGGNHPDRSRKVTNGRRARIAGSAVVGALLVLSSGLTSIATPAAAGPLVSVIVREAPAAGDRPERLVAALGGAVVRRLPLINGFAARVPRGSLAALRTGSGVAAVSADAAVSLTGGFDGFDPKLDQGSMYSLAQEVTGAGEFWNDRFHGQGVDVALIDSGVAPVEGLSGGKVIHGPDLSFESQHDAFRYGDTYGHGTHLAGIIAGRDSATPRPVQKGEEDHFVGMAPEARIVSLKVADSHGNTDVSQVIAAIDWVVEHRRSGGLNIRVLNLSFGTDGVQDHRFDPLAYAVEMAWRAGIVVVVAAGNNGYGSARLNNPATDPLVIAVGGADGRATYTVADDVIGSWSSRGDATRRPDLVAPGTSVVSLLSPGSLADMENPSARVGTRQIRGTGTSQATAVVSGAAALIISQRPWITPDQVKLLLTATARNLPSADPLAQGAGMIDLKVARIRSTPSPHAAAQHLMPALGIGSLEASRGTQHLRADGVELRGEIDIFGTPYACAPWVPCPRWEGGVWNGNRWSGDGWLGNRWSGAAWTGHRWSGASWSGEAWSANRWSADGWSGGEWLSNRWSADSWSSNRWSIGAWE